MTRQINEMILFMSMKLILKQIDGAKELADQLLPKVKLSAKGTKEESIYKLVRDFYNYYEQHSQLLKRFNKIGKRLQMSHDYLYTAKGDERSFFELAAQLSDSLIEYDYESSVYLSFELSNLLRRSCLLEKSEVVYELYSIVHDYYQTRATLISTLNAFFAIGKKLQELY